MTGYLQAMPKPAVWVFGAEAAICWAALQLMTGL